MVYSDLLCSKSLKKYDGDSYNWITTGDSSEIQFLQADSTISQERLNPQSAARKLTGYWQKTDVYPSGNLRSSEPSLTAIERGFFRVRLWISPHQDTKALAGKLKGCYISWFMRCRAIYQRGKFRIKENSSRLFDGFPYFGVLLNVTISL